MTCNMHDAAHPQALKPYLAFRFSDLWVRYMAPAAFARLSRLFRSANGCLKTLLRLSSFLGTFVKGSNAFLTFPVATGFVVLPVPNRNLVLDLNLVHSVVSGHIVMLVLSRTLAQSPLSHRRCLSSSVGDDDEIHHALAIDAMPALFLRTLSPPGLPSNLCWLATSAARSSI